jgi:hypothetical protein
LWVFAGLAVAGVALWHWSSTAGSLDEDATLLAIQQFQNSDLVAAELQQASLAQNYWPLVWPALIALVGGVLFWEDVERLWNHPSPPTPLPEGEGGGRKEDHS